MKVGDTVVAVPPYALACGSGRYSRAVVVGINPLVLVSECGDMLWYATLYDGCVKSIGLAPKRVRKITMKRYESDVRLKVAPAQEVSAPQAGEGE